jgi:putative hydrolase of the HAD superfamily
MKFRAVLFDAAETLFTTRGSVGEIYSSLARDYGCEAPPDVIQAAFARQFRGAGPLSVEDQKRWWKDVVHRVFAEVGMVRDFDEFFDRVYDTFRDSQGWALFPETLAVLKQLKGLGLKLGVISNFDTRIYSVLESLGIRSLFDAIILSSETGHSKPDPEIFEAAIAALGFQASQIILVGDSLRDDIEAGSRAGLAAVLIDRRGQYAAQDGVRRISSLSEVQSLIV